jgi:hypothetical protein
MTRTRLTWAEIAEIVDSWPFYDARTGKRIPTRAEWEQFSRWRRWRDIVLGWDPPKERERPWARD